MRIALPERAIGAMFLIVIASLSPVSAQERGPAGNSPTPSASGTILPSNPHGSLTAKERLGEKWKDEQRIDNCKVPLDKRGPKPRPDACPNAPTG
jgi:hypothetical protein